MDREKIYREKLSNFKTTEEKIIYLEECKFSIDMIDVWDETDRECYSIVSKLLKEIKEEK